MEESYDDKQARLQAAFAKVKNPTDRKARVSALVDPADIPAITEAVIYFTGTVPEFRTRKDGRVRCIAVGYRMGPCGDR